MGAFRAFFGEHSRLTALLVALALVMKAAIPAGYMLGTQDNVLTVVVCSDASGEHMAGHAMPPGSGMSEGHGKAGQVCDYASLSLASLESGDLPFIALALAFLLLLGFAPVRIPRLTGEPHIRPPLRGPPALI